jgi:hypothetical protein
MSPGAGLRRVALRSHPCSPARRRARLLERGQNGHDEDIRQFRRNTALRVLTPGSSAAEPLHILSSLERRSRAWSDDPDGSRAAISLVLRLLGKDPDPAKSSEHVLLSVLAERRLQQNQTAELGSLLDEVLNPPIERVGALPINDFLALKERKNLAATLNTLLASPTFASWRVEYRSTSGNG